MDDDSDAIRARMAAAEFRKQCVEFLDGVLAEIEAFGDEVNILSSEHLAALRVRQVEALDIDEHSVDFGPRFFSPRFTADEAREMTTDFIADYYDDVADDEQYCGSSNWPKRCRRGSFDEDLRWNPNQGPLDPEEPHPLCNPEQGAEFRSHWFLTVMGTGGGFSGIESPNLGVWEDCEWYCTSSCRIAFEDRSSMPGHAPPGIRVGTPPRTYSFRPFHVFLIDDVVAAEKPHIGASVSDASEAEEGQVLRSEVVTAVALLRLQFFRGDLDRGHHTLPAIVYSFQHDRFGRVSQFHFDGRSLVMRQSRLLDFRSDEPTTDAYHMMRWMANRPMGETKVRETPKDDGEEESELQDLERHTGKLPVEMRGA